MLAQPGISHHVEGRTQWSPGVSLIHRPLPPYYCHLRAGALLAPGLPQRSPTPESGRGGLAPGRPEFPITPQPPGWGIVGRLYTCGQKCFSLGKDQRATGPGACILLTAAFAGPRSCSKSFKLSVFPSREWRQLRL